MEEKNLFEHRKVVFIRDDKDALNADGVRGHLEDAGEAVLIEGFYCKYVKRFFDIILSFMGLILLSPVYLLVILAVLIDDPGPVFFEQKRIGFDKKYFKLHKFRTMKMSTPHDVPTHMLVNPDSYITRVGKFLRRTSLDELPQIWDILVGNMTIVGPRPALWNQDYLVAQRDLYNANSVRPGLTGWAQVHGRDELSIEEKAKLDGEYVKNISFGMDVKCFMLSIVFVIKRKSVVEGSKDN